MNNFVEMTQLTGDTQSSNSCVALPLKKFEDPDSSLL